MTSRRQGDGLRMDFLTAMAYWGIVLLIIVNVFLVSRMEVRIDDDEAPER
jgi:Ni,Fe-hydrogenase I cytochrome b subunit